MTRLPHRLSLSTLSLCRALTTFALAASALAGCETRSAPSSCSAARPCESGSACIDGFCEEARDRTILIDAPDARACEVLVEDREEKVRDVQYRGARGAHVREAPRTAIAVHADGDGALPADAIRVRASGDGDSVAIESARCWGASGAAIASATARVGS